MFRWYNINDKQRTEVLKLVDLFISTISQHTQCMCVPMALNIAFVNVLIGDVEQINTIFQMKRRRHAVRPISYDT